MIRSLLPTVVANRTSSFLKSTFGIFSVIFHVFQSLPRVFSSVITPLGGRSHPGEELRTAPVKRRCRSVKRFAAKGPLEFDGYLDCSGAFPSCAWDGKPSFSVTGCSFFSLLRVLLFSVLRFFSISRWRLAIVSMGQSLRSLGP